MSDASPPLLDITAGQREAVVRKWLARTFATYPDQTSRLLLNSRDPFQNPVGRALREGLPVLFEELAGGFQAERIRPVLDEIVHIRAVQDFTASDAVGFIFFLKSIIREEAGATSPGLTDLENRVDRMALMAFDLYLRCREKMLELKVNEARRRVFVMERVAARRANS